MCRFLLVSINIEAVLGEVTIGLRREKLEETARGNGLSDAYTANLARLKEQKGSKAAVGLKVLKWVLYSERPLRAEELCHALAVEMGSQDLDPKNIPVLRTLLSSCLGLVTVEASSSIVRLVHFTLQEHLLSNPTLFHSPHSTIAEVCLAYLNFGCIRNLSPIVDSAPSTMPLLEYASFYWGEHARMEMTENVKILALKLLDSFNKHISAQLLLLRYTKGYWYHDFKRKGGPIGFTGLHGVAFLGVGEILAAVLKTKEWDVNATDCTGSTPLTWASRKGHEEVVKLLLEQDGVNPDDADTYFGQTPLSWAAEKGHEGVVKILLGREDVDPNRTDTGSGRAPLSWAAANGHEGVVRILLEREDVDPNKADTDYGRTPLLWAAGWGHEGAVKVLLEREDLNPDKPDDWYGRTPLSWAAKNGHERVVGMLLKREGVDPDHPDIRYYRTPLSLAAESGHEAVVKLLLQRQEVDPAKVDCVYGRTPLAWAVECWHEGAQNMLLERVEVKPAQADAKYDRTPIPWAAEHGREAVAKMLLERKDINPNQGNTDYSSLGWPTAGMRR